MAPVPTASVDQAGPIRDWRKLQVVTVATDPGFPDPRVTPTPSPTPKPTHTPSPEPTYIFPTATAEPSAGPTGARPRRMRHRSFPERKWL